MKISLIVTLTVLLAAGSAFSQQIDDEVIDELNQELDQLSKDVADEYLDILDNISGTLKDYSDYVKEMPSDAADHDIKIIGTMQDNLNRGAYVDNPEKLLDDLYAAIDSIKAVENEHRVKFNTNSPKCCRLGRSLRKELIISAELVEDYLDQPTSQVLGKDEIKKYVNEALKALREIDQAKGVQGIEAEKVRKAMEALRTMGLPGRVVYVPDGTKSPQPPVIVLPSQPPSISWSYSDSKGETKKGAQHQTVGQVQASQPDWPIRIENPSGEIIIVGSNVKTITATLNLEVSAESHEKETEYLDRAMLVVAQEEGQYSVTVDLPRLSDHRTELLTSTLEVSVPRTNKIICTGANGPIRISDIDGGVKVDGDKSEIEVVRINGGATIRNAMGPVTAEEIKGIIDIETSYSPIELSHCDGRTSIENQYAAITMMGCQGVTQINNTGQIEISNHSGNVTIENAYGRIEVDRLTGDLIATNGYQPLVVTEISGSAELENAYGEISVDGVGSSLSATNNNGQIFVESSQGPVELSNSYGNISVSLERGFKGGSSITNTGGTIKLSIIQQPDLVLSLHTIGGSITSSLPLSVRSRGDAKTAELELGDGGESLDVSGDGSAIVIQGR